MADSLVQRFTALKDAATRAAQDRARAETTLQHAQSRLAQLDAKIRELGIEPDQLDAELTRLDAQLTKDADTLEQALKAETAAYREILG